MVRGYPRKPRYTYPKTFSKILWTTPLPHTRVSFVMPNHTANNFTITGPKDTVLAFIERAKDKNPDELDPQELSFNSLLPLPKELKGIASPVRIMTQDQIDEVWAEWNERKSQDKLGAFEKNGPFGLGLTREQSEELISKYGSCDWYSWCVSNWGTKWNCYDVTEWNVHVRDEYTASATIYYETAWSPATMLWLKVSTEYPDCEFYHEFADEGGGFLGSETIVNGRVISEEELDWMSEDGIELREGLGRYWPGEEEENVDEARVNE